MAQNPAQLFALVGCFALRDELGDILDALGYGPRLDAMAKGISCLAINKAQVAVWLMLIAPAGNGSALELFAAYVVPLLAGSLLAAGLGAEAIASKPPAGARYGRAHAIALAIGLATSIILSWQFDHPGAHWIMTLFVVRALDDPGTHRKKALWTGLATMLGAVTAALVTLMPLPPSLFTVLGALFLLIGLRLMPLPDAKSSLFMSAGVVLATAPTLDAALYRGGAAFFASLLAIMLSYASAVMTERLERTRLVEGGRDEI